MRCVRVWMVLLTFVAAAAFSGCAGSPRQQAVDVVERMKKAALDHDVEGLKATLDPKYADKKLNQSELHLAAYYDITGVQVVDASTVIVTIRTVSLSLGDRFGDLIQRKLTVRKLDGKWLITNGLE